MLVISYKYRKKVQKIKFQPLDDPKIVRHRIAMIKIAIIVIIITTTINNNSNNENDVSDLRNDKDNLNNKTTRNNVINYFYHYFYDSHAGARLLFRHF